MRSFAVYLKMSLCLVLSLFYLPAASQPFQNGHISITFIDSARNNRAVPVEIYYPADVAGDNVSFTAALSKAPTIAFGHGFVMGHDAYFNVRDAVVGAGYIIAFPTTEGSLSPSHQNFGDDLAFVLRELAEPGNTSGSVLSGRIDSMNCVMGHSMGGGAAFLAAAGNNSIKAIATLAAAETSPSAIGAAGSIGIPALVIAGGNDCVTPPAAHQEPMYNALASACKTYISISGGSHCQMAESNFACNFGESTCTPQPAITRAQQHEVLERYLLPWLDFQLRGICTQGAYFDSALATDGAVSYQRNCSLCPALGLTTNTHGNAAQVYPNPCPDRLYVKGLSAGSGEVRIYSLNGKLLLEEAAAGAHMEIDVSSLPSGTYLYELSGQPEEVWRGTFVKE